MRHREPLTKDSVFVAVMLAIAAITSIVGMVLATLSFLQEGDRPKPEGWSPPPIEQLHKKD